MRYSFAMSFFQLSMHKLFMMDSLGQKQIIYIQVWLVLFISLKFWICNLLTYYNTSLVFLRIDIHSMVLFKFNAELI